MPSNSTVFIIDDDHEVREAIELLLQSIGLVSKSYESAQAYLDDFDPQASGCLVLDVRMRGMSGLDLQNHLNTLPQSPPVIIITGHGDIPMAVQAVQKGAANFIEKPFKEQVLLDSIHRAIEHDAEQRGKALIKEEIQSRLDLLTPRERQVINEVVTGKRNKSIANDLNITLSTVEAHRAKGMEKLQAKSLSHLMRMMISLTPK
ncbi:MAG: response regulator transcription factor [Thiotrichaceae bacterium]|nr:response regulator transcription factor [Thiotrichaceae bacterium]